jgi:hypothetical protein
VISPSSIDASICLIVGLVNTSRIDSFRSDFCRAELFRLFARVPFLFGLTRLGAIRSVTGISHCIIYSRHTPARTASQRTSPVEAEADVANGLTAEALFYSSQDFGLGDLFELVVQCRYADIEDSLAKCDWGEMYGDEVADDFRPRVDHKRSSVQSE